MGHRCCSKQKVKRGLWSPEEDEKLLRFITCHGHSSWSVVPRLAGLERCGKSCRLRWINYLRPDLKRGSFTEEEERTIIEVHRILGNRWAQIAKHLPGRTDNEVKNFWNSCIKKKLLAHGFDPNTHNLLPPTRPNKSSPNKTPKKQKRANEHDHRDNHQNSPTNQAVFTVDNIRSHKRLENQTLVPTALSSYQAPPTTNVDSNTFEVNVVNNITANTFDTSLINPPSGDIWVDSGLTNHTTNEHQLVTTSTGAHNLQLQVEIVNNDIQEINAQVELQMIKRLQMSDGPGFDHPPPFSSAINGGSAFDFGFGDHYDAILQGDAIYGDVATSMDHLAWDDIAY